MLKAGMAMSKSIMAAMVLILGGASVATPEAAAQAANSGAANSGASKADAKKKKSTEVSFDDVLVQGKYHFADEAVTTVEDDKVLDALLGVRTDFKDRVKKSTARH
jgi:hypothetical protein